MINNFLDSISKVYEFEFYVVDMRKVREKDLNLLSTLSEKEYNYLEELKIEKNKIQWISGRYAVKSALFKYKLERSALMDLSCVDIMKREDSSPYIVQYPGIHVSITHSFPYCIGLVSNRKIGIDLESIGEKKESLIRYFYADAEKEFLERFQGTREYWQQAMMFWTRKEAVSKLLRLGMRMDFRKLDTLDDEIVWDDCVIWLKSFVCGGFVVSIAREC